MGIMESLLWSNGLFDSSDQIVLPVGVHINLYFSSFSLFVIRGHFSDEFYMFFFCNLPDVQRQVNGKDIQNLGNLPYASFRVRRSAIKFPLCELLVVSLLTSHLLTSHSFIFFHLWLEAYFLVLRAFSEMTILIIMEYLNFIYR